MEGYVLQLATVITDAARIMSAKNKCVSGSVVDIHWHDVVTDCIKVLGHNCIKYQAIILP
jgi:hypothetical protein